MLTIPERSLEPVLLTFAMNLAVSQPFGLAPSADLIRVPSSGNLQLHNELSWPHLVLSLASARHFVLTIERLAPHPRTPSPSGRLHLQRQSTRWRCPPQRPPAPMQHQMAMQQEVEIIIRGIRIANTQSSRRQW